MSHLRSLSAMLEKGHEIATRGVHVVWAVRHADLASGVLKDDITPWLEESKIGSRIDVRFDIYATQEATPAAPHAVETSMDSALNSSGEDFGFSKGLDECSVSPTGIKNQGKESFEEEAQMAVQFYTGRPLLQDICLGFAGHASSDDGRAALVCCGPPTMADDVRAIVVKALQTGSDNLDFFPESFSW